MAREPAPGNCGRLMDLSALIADIPLQSPTKRGTQWNRIGLTVTVDFRWRFNPLRSGAPSGTQSSSDGADFIRWFQSPTKRGTQWNPYPEFQREKAAFSSRICTPPLRGGGKGLSSTGGAIVDLEIVKEHPPLSADRHTSTDQRRESARGGGLLKAGRWHPRSVAHRPRLAPAAPTRTRRKAPSHPVPGRRMGREPPPLRVTPASTQRGSGCPASLTPRPSPDAAAGSRRSSPGSAGAPGRSARIPSRTCPAPPRSCEAAC